jgi:hypothetical protein
MFGLRRCVLAACGVRLTKLRQGRIRGMRNAICAMKDHVREDLLACLSAAIAKGRLSSDVSACDNATISRVLVEASVWARSRMGALPAVFPHLRRIRLVVRLLCISGGHLFNAWGTCCRRELLTVDSDVSEVPVVSHLIAAMGHLFEARGGKLVLNKVAALESVASHCALTGPFGRTRRVHVRFNCGLDLITVLWD